jgi:uncharacterized membrane protein YfcA
MALIGFRMVRDLVRAPGASASEEAFHRGAGGGTRYSVRSEESTWTRLRFVFCDEVYEVPVPSLTALTFGVGLVGGAYGIGGGSIIAPFLVSVYGLPVYAIAGPVLMATFITSIVGVGAYQLLAPLYPEISVAPDWTLGLLFGLGGMAGMYLGARCQKWVPAAAIKWLLAAILVLTAAKYAIDAGWS